MPAPPTVIKEGDLLRQENSILGFHQA